MRSCRLNFKLLSHWIEQVSVKTSSVRLNEHLYLLILVHAKRSLSEKRAGSLIPINCSNFEKYDY